MTRLLDYVVGLGQRAVVQIGHRILVERTPKACVSFMPVQTMEPPFLMLSIAVVEPSTAPMMTDFGSSHAQNGHGLGSADDVESQVPMMHLMSGFAVSMF